MVISRAPVFLHLADEDVAQRSVTRVRPYKL